MNEKILGCILGAAVGDAMGAATETKSINQIKEFFGDKVTSFKQPPDDTLARGRKAGQITDAFSIPYILTEHLIKSGGKMSQKIAEEALLEWGDTEYFEPFAGMTTRSVVNRLRNDASMGTWAHAGRLGTKIFKSHYYALSSNGAASKAYPAAILSKGNNDAAIHNAVELTMASHDDPYSISGACAVSAAICESLKDQTNLQKIIQSAIDGSVKGEELARNRKDIWLYPGPSVTKRIHMALQIAAHSGKKEELINELRERIGSGPAISESVPIALGIILVNEGDTMESIYDAVNIGDETSSIACIVGAIVGAYNGYGSITDGYLEIIEKENQIDLKKQARELESLVATV